MTHDPLCPLNDEQWLKHPLEKCYYCELIAAVREDERTRHQGQSVMLASDAEAAIAAARADMLAKCITALEVEMEGETQDRVDGLWDAIVALRALQEKP
jgi:hypothetical protein